MLRLVTGFLALLATSPVQTWAGFSETDLPVSPSGVKAVVDLPISEHMRNTGGMGPRGPGSGSGLCVYTSAEVTGHGWHNESALKGFQRWMTSRPGGGYPEKFAAMLKQYCDSQRTAVPPYVQHTGGDMAFLDLAVKTRRMVCVTYAGMDGFYRGLVYHMVNLAHLDKDTAAIIDNNRPNKWVWMTRQEFQTRWTAGGQGWAIVFLSSPAPPRILGAEDPGCKCGFYCKCGNDPCRCVSQVRPLTPLPKFEGWVEVKWADGTTGHKLYRGGRFAGYLGPDGWHPAVGHDSWEANPRGEAPVEGPNNPLRPLAKPENFGIEPGKIHQDPRWWNKDGETNRAAAVRLVDDSAKFYLSLVSKEPLKITLGTYDQWVRTQVYDPESWVTKSRLHTVVTLQKPDGKVVWTSDKIDATEIEEQLKKTDPNWRPPPPKPEPKPEPAPEPRPKNPDPFLPPDDKKNVPGWILIVLGLLFGRLTNKKE